ISVSMVFSVMADLCVGGIKHLIELHAPIINRINPAALITDCFYSLNVYDDYSVFTQKIVIMAVESVVLTVIAFMMIRRNKYASI
ncbi:MAG: ABC transporter permease, partial [Coprococcus sp.]